MERGTHMVIPGLIFVVDNSRTKTSSRIDASASDWDGCQMNHELQQSQWEVVPKPSHTKQKTLHPLN